MEPFPVSCETCHARLKVRSESVIGHILACPKCGSMVHITPPASPGEEPGMQAAEGGDASPSSVLSRPIALWASGSAALLLTAALVGVLLTRGEAGSNEPHDSIPATVEVAPLTADDEGTEQKAEGEVRNAEAEAAPPSALPVPNVETVARETEATDAGEETVEIDAAAEVVAATPPDPQPQIPSRQSLPPGFAPLRFDSAPADVDSHTTDEEGSTSEERVETETSPLASLPPPAVDDPRAAVRLGPMSSDALRPRDAEQQLALPIASIDVQSVPLTQVLDMLSDMTNVPITLDPSALMMVGISSRRSVTVQAQDTTVAALLNDVLDKLGLDYEVRAGQVIIVKPGVDRRRSVDYELKDLVSPGEADAARLAGLVQRFVKPSAWQVNGGQGSIEVDGTTLRIEQSDRVHYPILLFCERLRLSHTLPTRSRYPAARLSIAPIYAQLDARLSTNTTFTFLPWTRLTEVFRHWEEASGVTVLVDWASLAELELGPASPVACSNVDRTWDEALEAILEPLGLGWWAVDGRTIQITSRDARDRILQVEFYPVPQSKLDQYADTDTLAASLRRDLEKVAGTARHGGAPRFDLEFDPASNRLIVLGPAEVHRQLAHLPIVHTAPDN